MEIEIRVSDAGGRMVQAATTSNSTLLTSNSYVYDNWDRVIERKIGLPIGEKVLKSVYDENGNRTQFSIPNSQSSIQYGYDGLNRLTELNDAETGKFAMGYDAGGRLLSRKDPNGITTSYTYDDADRTTEIKSVTSNFELLISNSYAYDKVGNVISRVSQLGGTSVKDDFTYDLRDRLVSENLPVLKGWKSIKSVYDYDLSDNRVKRVRTRDDLAPRETTYGVNSWNQIVSAKSTGGSTLTVSGTVADDHGVVGVEVSSMSSMA